jgi:heterotetrameric sarcosine oxidase delta subunit
MMLIPCPYCGPRDVTEFSYGGDGNVRQPAADATLSEWSDYVYVRDNPRGPHTEHWQHSAGCRRWIRVRRNTLTHEVLGSEPAHRRPASGEPQ